MHPAEGPRVMAMLSSLFAVAAYIRNDGVLTGPDSGPLMNRPRPTFVSSGQDKVPI